MVNPEIDMNWEDGGSASVNITCCNKTESDMFDSGDSWTCPTCGTEVSFHWKGMEYKIHKAKQKEDVETQ